MTKNMNIQQMHIEVELSLQKINSAVKRKFDPEEIDWILNKQILRFVKSKIKRDPDQKEGGFQFDEIDSNAVRTLIVTDKEVPVYKNSLSEKFVSAEFPGNYAYIISSTAGLVRDCHAIYPEASNFVQGNESIYILPIKKTTKVDSPFYQNVSVKIANTDLVPESAFPVSLPDPDMLFTIQEVIRDYLSRDVRVYWETYKDLYYEQTLIIASPTALATISYNVDGASSNATLVSKSRFLPANTNEIESKKNRLPRTTLVEAFQDSSFAKSRWLSPISAVQNNTLKVYHDNKFIVNKLWINYIRKPKMISLSLNKSCDLPEEFHNDVCDLAVEYIKNAIGDPNYQWKVQDNNTRRE